MTTLLDEYLTREGLAAELHVTPRTISRYENEGDGLPSTTIGGRKYYHTGSVKQWLKNRERRPNPRRSRGA